MQQRQYQYVPQTDDQLRNIMMGAVWNHPGKTTLLEYTNTLPWGVERSVLLDTMAARPYTADIPISKF